MKTWVLFLRGVNVGGNHILPMKDLKSLLKKLGAQDVQTYLQSGNAVFRHAQKLDVESAILKKFKFQSIAFVLTERELVKAASKNPYPQADIDPKSLHLMFLSGQPQKLDPQKVTGLLGEKESFKIIGKVLYFYSPNGIGKSRLFPRLEKMLGCTATSRNWNTITNVMKLTS